jgi:hypothetical protein
MEVASTNSNPVNLNESLSTGRHGARDLLIHKFTRSVQQNSSHKNPFRAKLRKKPENLYWSSHQSDGIVEEHPASVKHGAHSIQNQKA